MRERVGTVRIEVWRREQTRRVDTLLRPSNGRAAKFTMKGEGDNNRGGKDKMPGQSKSNCANNFPMA